MRIYLAALTLLMALSSGVCAIGIDEWSEKIQPDGTTFEAHVFGDEFAGHKRTADGYEFVYSGGWYYYAELDAQGEYVASPYKVGIDDPDSNGIPKNLQRSAVRIAEIDAVRIARGYARDPDSAAKRLAGDPSHFVCSFANKCKAYVVLVTFADRTTGWYANDDQPSVPPDRPLDFATTWWVLYEGHTYAVRSREGGVALLYVFDAEFNEEDYKPTVFPPSLEYIKFDWVYYPDGVPDKDTAVQPISWGQVKARHRQRP